MPTEMSAPDRVSQLMHLPFSVVVVRTETGGVAHCADLGLFATGAGPAEALAALEADKRAFFERYVKAGEPVALAPAPAGARAAAAPDDGLLRLALRTAFATVSVAATLGAMLLLLGVGVASALPSSGQMMDSLWNAVGTFGNVRPDRQERWRANAAAAAVKLKPVTDELAPLFGFEGCKP